MLELFAVEWHVKHHVEYRDCFATALLPLAKRNLHHIFGQSYVEPNQRSSVDPLFPALLFQPHDASLSVRIYVVIQFCLTNHLPHLFEFFFSVRGNSAAGSVLPSRPPWLESSKKKDKHR